MSNFWRKGSDTLHNGSILGALAGLFIWQGQNVYSWLLLHMPNNWSIFGSYSMPIYLIVGGAIIGYAIDRM